MFAVDNSLCNGRAIRPSKIQIQMDRLLRTSLYRALLKSLTRKAVSENRLRNYFLDFAQQVTIICDDTENITYLWQNRFSDKTQLVNMHLCIFVRQEDGLYKRIDEEQKQKAHEAQHLAELMQAAGFDRVMLFGNGRMEPPREGEQRWHFAAVRRLDPGKASDGGASI